MYSIRMGRICIGTWGNCFSQQCAATMVVYAGCVGGGLDEMKEGDARAASVGVEKEKKKGAGAAAACVWDWKALKGYVESARRDYAFNRKNHIAKKLCGD